MRNATDMPAPDEVIDYGEGRFAMAMFHYADEEANCDAIAKEHGFETTYRVLANDDSEAARALDDEYSNGASDVPERWSPEIPEGWALACKADSDDGPIAMFIRKRAAS